MEKEELINLIKFTDDRLSNNENVSLEEQDSLSEKWEEEMKKLSVFFIKDNADIIEFVQKGNLQYFYKIENFKDIETISQVVNKTKTLYNYFTTPQNLKKKQINLVNFKDVIALEIILNFGKDTRDALMRFIWCELLLKTKLIIALSLMIY